MAYPETLPGTVTANVDKVKASWGNAMRTALDSSLTKLSNRTTIEGFEMLWAGTASLTILSGFCNAEDGSYIYTAGSIPLTGLSLDASSLNHVYVYNSSGAATAEVGTVEPSAWMGIAYSQTGDTTKRYIGSVLTDGSSNILEFSHNVHNNYIAHINSALGTASYRVLSNGSATTYTSVDCSGAIPATSKLAYFRIQSTADAFLLTSTDGTQAVLSLSTGTVSTQNAFMNHPLDSSRNIQYRYTGGTPTTGGAIIDIYGYYFDR